MICKWRYIKKIIQFRTCIISNIYFSVYDKMLSFPHRFAIDLFSRLGANATVATTDMLSGDVIITIPQPHKEVYKISIRSNLPFILTNLLLKLNYDIIEAKTHYGLDMEVSFFYWLCSQFAFLSCWITELYTICVIYGVLEIILRWDHYLLLCDESSS